MKAAKAIKKKLTTKGRSQKAKKPENAKEGRKRSPKSTNSSCVRLNSRKPNAAGPFEGSTCVIQTAADERRLRKLKVFLKSVSYNGSEGTILPNLNELYVDQLLVDEFPCTELSKNEEFKGNPTPFVIASCFNRTQVTENSNNSGKGVKGTRRTPRKQHNTPRKRNQQGAGSVKTTKEDARPKPNQPLALQQLKAPLSAEKKNPARRLFHDSDNSGHIISPKKQEIGSVTQSPLKLGQKKAVEDQKERVPSFIQNR